MKQVFRRSTICAALAAAMLLWPAGPAAAQPLGDEQDGVAVTVATEWPERLHGGYWPIRIRVQSSRPREIRFTARASYDGRFVSRTVQISPAGQSRFTLLWPVSEHAYPRIEFEVDGQAIKARHPGASASRIAWETAESSVVVAKSVHEPFVERLKARSTYGRYFVERIDPRDELPDCWQGYLGLGKLCISLADLEALPADRRMPMLDWAATGGCLVVVGIGNESPDKVAQRLLGPGPRLVTSQVMENPGRDREKVTTWGHGCGQLVLVSSGFENQRLAAALPDSTGYEKISDRLFWRGEFAVPGVGQPPVEVLITLMCVFTLVAGPVNLFVLRWKNRQHWMLLTVPAVSLLVVLTAVGYTVLNEGFDVKGRVSSFTWLDGRGQAVTMTRQAAYTGWSPGPVQFSPGLAVLGQFGGDDRGPQIDWTDGQRIANLLPARTQRLWLSLGVQPARQRLIVERVDNRWLAGNGLGVGIVALYIRTADGAILRCGPVLNGEKAVLELPAMQSVPPLEKLGLPDLLPGQFIAVVEQPLFDHTGSLDIQQRQLECYVAGQCTIAQPEEQ